MQREMVAMLLQESEMGVIQCENAEAALDVLEKMGALLSMMFTDVNLTGHIDGVELAHFTHQHYPNINVIVNWPCADERTARRGNVHAQTMDGARLAA